MNVIDYAEQFRKTNAPFAVDRTNLSVASRTTPPIVRAFGCCSVEYVIRGKGTVTENNTTFHVKAGDVFILHKGAYHNYFPDPDDPWVRIWVQISGPSSEEILRAYGLSQVNHIPNFNLEEDLFKIRSVIQNDTDLTTVDREGPRLCLKLMQKIHEELRRRELVEHTPSLPKLVRERIDNLPNGYITLDQLSEEFHFSKQYIIRRFKDRYGITPHEYILNRRTGLAQSLLKRTDLSVKQISDQLQFCDIAYFTDFFHRRTGMTPLEYRKKYR